MPDYKETAVTGTQWQRCNGVTISNPFRGQPTVQMQEETIAQVGDNVFAQTAAGIVFDFDPAEKIDLRNPQTGELVGASMTGMDLYVALYSLYIAKAHERDAALTQAA
jgi:hypothetical protein